MSPDTLDLFQTLSEDIILSPKIDYSKNAEKEERCIVQHFIGNEPETDFSADVQI